MPLMTWPQRVQLATVSWSPRSLSGLILWLDATHLGQADTTPVSVWYDQSGQGNHALQGTVAAQPTYRAVGINGRPSIVFDGVDDYMEVADVPAFHTSDITVVTVRQSSATTGTLWRKYLQYAESMGNTGSDYGVAFNNTTPGWAWIDTTVPISTTAQVMGVVYATTLSEAIFALNSIVVALPVSGPITPSSSPLVVGAWNDAGTPQGFFTGDAGELLLYRRALAAAELRMVMRWLGRKWGINVG